MNNLIVGPIAEAMKSSPEPIQSKLGALPLIRWSLELIYILGCLVNPLNKLSLPVLFCTIYLSDERKNELIYLLSNKNSYNKMSLVLKCLLTIFTFHNKVFIVSLLWTKVGRRFGEKVSKPYLALDCAKEGFELYGSATMEYNDNRRFS